MRTHIEIRTLAGSEMNIRVVQLMAGLICSLFFLAFTLYRVQLGSVAAALANADLMWFAAAVSAYAANLLMRAWRWQMIVRPVAAIPYPIVARTLLVGYGLNNIMPLRLGELFRVEFLKRSLDFPRVWALTSIVIERLFDGLTVVGCLGLGLYLSAKTSQTTGILIGVLVTAGILFGVILVAALSLSGATALRVLSGFPRLSARMNMVQSGFEILRTWRTVGVGALTLVVYLPDALSLWFIVKAVGLKLGFASTLVLVGSATLSTLIPSGPAFLGTLQLAYAGAIEFSGGPRAIGIAAATLAQLCLLLPVALIAIAILIQGSTSLFFSLLGNWKSDDAPAGP